MITHLITKIEPQKRNKNRVNIHDTDGFLTSLSYESVLRHSLKEGMELGEDLLETLKKEDTVKYAKEISMGYIAYTPRTRRQVEQHLEKKGIDESSISEAVATLLKYGYLNDAAYVREFARSYSGKLGEHAMRSKLRERGVAAWVIDENLEIPEEQQYNVAVALVEKLKKRYRGQPIHKQKQKLYGALARKGFGYELINRVLAQAELEGEEECTDELW